MALAPCMATGASDNTKKKKKKKSNDDHGSNYLTILMTL